MHKNQTFNSKLKFEFVMKRMMVWWWNYDEILIISLFHHHPYPHPTETAVKQFLSRMAKVRFKSRCQRKGQNIIINIFNPAVHQECDDLTGEGGHLSLLPPPLTGTLQGPALVVRSLWWKEGRGTLDLWPAMEHKPEGPGRFLWIRHLRPLYEQIYAREAL